MYHFDKRLQWPVKVEKPDPLFARQLQQVIGGVEGEIGVFMQYCFQACGAHGPTTKYRDMPLHTATEEIGHIETLATAVAVNLDKAPVSEQEAGAADGLVGAIMGGGDTEGVITGMLQRPILSAYPANSNGVPFGVYHIHANENLAADVCCHVAAESTGRVLACRPHDAAPDTGLREMPAFMIARDTLYQRQWLAVIEELGEEVHLPVPNSCDQSREPQKFPHAFFGSAADGTPPMSGRWTDGLNLDAEGEFSAMQDAPMGGEPVPGPARADSYAQREQM